MAYLAAISTATTIPLFIRTRGNVQPVSRFLTLICDKSRRAQYLNMHKLYYKQSRAQPPHSREQRGLSVRSCLPLIAQHEMP